MKAFRSLLFWTHVTAGLVGGVVILVMSLTGVVLALRPQIQNWVDREVRQVSPQGERLAPSALLDAVRTARPGVNPQSVALERDRAVAASVNLGRDGNVFINPYTGVILGQPSKATTSFFQSMTAWHRYVNATGELRPTGRAWTGASNLAFLLLGVTGLYIWWPRQLTLRHFRPILWFKPTAAGKARDFNWHNVIGFWCAIPIVIMTASGAVISYPWASNLVYTLTGSPVPPRAPSAALRAGGANAGAARGEADPAAAGRGGAGRPAADGATIIPAALDLLFSRAEQQVPTWAQLSFRLPSRDGAPVQFTLTDGAQWNAFARSQLTLNAATGEVENWQPYEAQSLGQKARGWLRFAHTGELGGLPGQLVAGLGCLGGVFLVYTGFALAARRLWNWSFWRRFSARTVNAELANTSARLPLTDER